MSSVTSPKPTKRKSASPESASPESASPESGSPESGNGTGNRSAQPHRSSLYSNLVPAYQALWPAIAGKNIVEAVRSLRIPSEAKVLEVGVGTGLSLKNYPTHADVTGVDLSESMLAEAEQLIDERQWRHINVLPMNAEKLSFPDSSFDFVTSFHTVSVVSDPRAMMREIVRVCRPGGRILIINHFRSENPLIARVVDSAGNITKRLGWRTDLDLDQVVGELPLRLDHRYKPNRLSFFTVMKATCKPDEAALSAAV